MKKIVLLLGLTLAGLANAAPGDSVSKEFWISEFRAKFPAYVCETQRAVLVDRFKMAAPECAPVMTLATDLCIEANKGQMPATLSQPDDGTKWGKLIGTCAGGAYEYAMKERLK